MDGAVLACDFGMTEWGHAEDETRRKATYFTKKERVYKGAAVDLPEGFH